ncbi:hypothetical protein GCM10029978_018560 [Actinoallomurus acanthiterrae]
MEDDTEAPSSELCGALAPDDWMDDFGWPRCDLPADHGGWHQEVSSGAHWYGED